ncbi:von Willebrand factor D and EGF domain-containing protein-like [Babylonia areolata]|uniref:von Willebrand factor D and EGF domain-containing protein-like n=1 Tax=Babylonia areolata TaxID=304850 RepID=UPI003FD1304E
MPDPCRSGNHQELSDARRSTSHLMKASEQALCDISLDNGWYRTACANFGTGHGQGCCDHSIPIGVKNCGAFYVYYLHPVPSCPVAYCSESDLPAVVTPPTLGGPETNGHAFRFKCHVDLPHLRTGQAVEVRWTADGQEMTGVPRTLLTATGTDHQTAVLPGMALTGGHLGKDVQPGHVTLSEKEDKVNVTLTSTVPIVCGLGDPASCCLHFEADFEGSADNVVTPHPCSYKLCSRDWDPSTHTASLTVPLTPVKDHMKDGDKETKLSFQTGQTVNGGPYLAVFDNYTLPSATVTVKDAPTRHCSWYSDPHIRGLEHTGRYHLFRVGDYTMYQSSVRHMEIQARTWPCGRHVTCVCGVAIRERNDVIRISQCEQAYQGPLTSPIIEVSSRPLHPSTSVQRSKDGKHIAVSLFLNVFVAVPSRDQGKGRGICGTFDLDAHNEFTHRDGVVSGQCNPRARLCIPTSFTESWRLLGQLLNNKTSSLFETVPPQLADGGERKDGYCSCDRGGNGTLRVACSSSPDLSVPRLLQADGNWLCLTEAFCCVRLTATGYFHMTSLKVWPTPSGITKTEAGARCQQALSSSQLWSVCQSFTQLTDFLLQDCVLDVQTECQITLAENPANYVTDTNGRNVLRPEYSSDVCSVFCARHGRCVRGKCVCHSGYMGDNCDLLEGRGPQLIRVRGFQGNTCDVNQRPCRKIFIDVTNIALTDTLMCSVTSRLADGTQSSVTLEGEFLSSGRLACPLPPTQGAAVTSFQVSVSSDGGEVYSNWLPVTAFDSSCQTCDTVGICTLREHTCLIDNQCHQNGDVNPSDDNQVCDVSSSSKHWTTKTLQLLSGPDANFLLTCALHTSGVVPSDARFRITWQLNGRIIVQEILGPDSRSSSF